MDVRVVGRTYGTEGSNMPKVGNKLFSYGKKGYLKAKKFAKKTGKKMMVSKKKMSKRHEDMGVY